MANNNPLFNAGTLGLCALTAAAIAGTAYGFKALQEGDKAVLVDAMQEPAPSGGGWPFVSIIVPARNEERNLPSLLPTLLGQRYPNYEVIVVDDQSRDNTACILAEWAARDPKLKVVQGTQLPTEDGWMGKPHAMMQGAQTAGREWILFTDADTSYSPYALSSALAYALSHDVDLLSILPHSELVTPAERLVMPVAFEGIATLFPTYKVNDPKSKIAIANGQFILIRREVYDAVGGIESVKGQIAEDLEFAKIVKSAGHRLRLIDGRDLMSVRMYTNFAELWEGWSKNTVLSFKENPGAGFLAALGIFLGTCLPMLMPRIASRSWKRAHESGRTSDLLNAAFLIALAVWSIATPLLHRRKVDKLLGLSVGWTLTMPIGNLVFACIMLNSVVRLATGKGVAWKGRIYANRKSSGG